MILSGSSASSEFALDVRRTKSEYDSVNDSYPPRVSKGEEPEHLKRVSRIKHIILEKYLPAWAQILGSTFMQLAHVDCFAGPGEYECDGKLVEGSPVIAVTEAIRFVRDRQGHNLLLYLVDDHPQQVERLTARLKRLQPYPRNLSVEISCADSRSFVPDLLGRLNSRTPAFFLIDPYGHPLPLPLIRRVLRRERTEVLINLMWFQINRDLSNPKVMSRLNELFGDNAWQSQPFMKMQGSEREKAFLFYFKSQLGCRYVREFKIRHDVEDIHGGDRTKYYLLHASNHVKAALLMKEVMWHLGDEEGTFNFSGESQAVLISETPPDQDLQNFILREFAGSEITFDELRERTWSLSFIEKNYRSVLKAREGKEITISRVTSKQTGIKGRDRIRFK